MITTKETHYCSQCTAETTHIVVLVRDEPQQNKVRDFLTGLIKSEAVGAFEASMDDFSRHSICEQCGKKTVNDNLT
ncbi:hypothetical protein [Vibrio atypicus]|uniref:hypothetical protein n=1 Tax=Vibrio atypicus TaxID=558271 RepID=UPI0013593B35|nr:hypothetical protein [Vibrio atypicus]